MVVLIRQTLSKVHPVGRKASYYVTLQNKMRRLRNHAVLRFSEQRDEGLKYHFRDFNIFNFCRTLFIVCVTLTDEVVMYVSAIADFLLMW